MLSSNHSRRLYQISLTKPHKQEKRGKVGKKREGGKKEGGGEICCGEGDCWE